MFDSYWYWDLGDLSFETFACAGRLMPMMLTCSSLNIKSLRQKMLMMLMCVAFIFGLLMLRMLTSAVVTAKHWATRARCVECESPRWMILMMLACVVLKITSIGRLMLMMLIRIVLNVNARCG